MEQGLDMSLINMSLNETGAQIEKPAHAEKCVSSLLILWYPIGHPTNLRLGIE